MALLTHQSFANPVTPYWASATEPTALISPLTVRDKQATEKVVVTANPNGTGGVFYAKENGTNPLGMGFVQGATQVGNQIVLDVGNVNAGVTVTTSNVVMTQPIVLDSPLNAQNFTILPTAGGVELQMGGVSGSVIGMNNGPTGAVSIMGASTFLADSMVVADKLGNDTTVNSKQVQFGNNAGNVAQVGLTGSSAYLGTFTAPLTTPGVLVNISNGCELQFTDASANVYGMKTTGGILTISAPSDPNAITVAPTGVVTIPNIVSGSFVPVGGIVMYSGSAGSLPANWKICDGTNGTPDLTGKFILGANGTYPSGTSAGSNIISISNLPSHGHSIADLTHSHTLYAPSSYDTFGRVGGTTNFAKDGATLTTSSVATGITKTNITVTSDNSGTVATIGQPYYPPFYALAYIMRVA